MTGYCTSNSAPTSSPVIMERARETGTNDKGGKEQEIIKRESDRYRRGGEEWKIRGEKERFINEDPWKEI